ncbi:Karyopherin transporter [Sorochytrium milnesiophthora]
MDRVLDFSTELDVGLFDNVVNVFYQQHGQQQQMAQQILTQFQENPDAWTRADAILERSQVMQSKVRAADKLATYIALQILEKLIQTKWKVLNPSDREGIKNYIVATILRISDDETALRQQKQYISKLNLVLVQILKQEWPHNWPNFIPEVVGASRTSVSLCENNMAILKLLSEEIFDFGAEGMTQTKIKHLKNQMNGEFSQIFTLCQEVLQNADKPSLLKATLETLLRFLYWIPLGYIFQTDIIDHLLKFLEAPLYRNTTLKCLTEIASLQVGPEHDQRYVFMFQAVLEIVQRTIPPGTDIAAIYDEYRSDDQEFVQNLALFFTTFLTRHLKIVETVVVDKVNVAHFYLLDISRVEEREIFKVCLEYWNKLVSELYEEHQHLPTAEFGNTVLNLPTMAGGVSPNLRVKKYTEVLSRLRVVMIERMVKPEEVLVVENEDGAIVRETMKEVDTIVLYKSMKEVLVYLTHLDPDDTESIMVAKLNKQIDGSEWSWQNLNKLCWAIGSIAYAMNEDKEKHFLVHVIRELLGLVEKKRGKDNKAVVASNIMYVVGQYPRFLRAHWRFLKTVVNKLFEFMHEYHEGVQDMACDTFMKIVQKCRKHFIVQQMHEHTPFIDEILAKIDEHTKDLSPQQVNSFYEAVALIIAVQSAKPVQQRLIADLMRAPNQAWDVLMQRANRNENILADNDSVKLINNILRTNTAACLSLGAAFYPQLGRLYMDMLGLYKVVSETISNEIAQDPVIGPSKAHVRALRAIKKEVLRLVETFVSRADDKPLVASELMPPLLEAILGDYKRNIPKARDAEVLNVVGTFIDKLGPLMADKVAPICDHVFPCTLEMINKEFVEFPEHRSGFFKLIRAINTNCFEALITLNATMFRLLIDSIVWGFKHAMRDIAEISLTVASDMFSNFSRADVQIANAFYHQYFLILLQEVFFILTDSEHQSGFKLQCFVLAQMINMVTMGQVQTPLSGNPEVSNVVFLREHITSMLVTGFPHLQPKQIDVFVLGLFELNSDLQRFKPHLRDFLIQLKEFAGDTADLYLEERELEIEKQKQEAHAKALQIPGMIKASERTDDMLDEF